MGDFFWEVMGELVLWDGDERLKFVYMVNKKFILSKGEIGLVKKFINYLVDNFIIIMDVVWKVEDIV